MHRIISRTAVILRSIAIICFLFCKTNIRKLFNPKSKSGIIIFSIAVLLAFLAAGVFFYIKTNVQYYITLNDAIIEPGKTLKIELNTEVPLKNIFVRFNSNYYKVFADSNGSLRGLIGVPLDLKQGIYELNLKFTSSIFALKDFAGVLYVQDNARKHEKINFSRIKKNLYKKERVLNGTDQKILEDAYKIVTSNQLWKGKFIKPVNRRITSGFGNTRKYNVKDKTASYHKGTDFSAPLGTKIRAANDGRVVLADFLILSGNTVALDHGQGVITIYKHMSRINVNKGQIIKKGEVIGISGSTGLSTAPHLHWELRISGVPVDPVEWTENIF